MAFNTITQFWFIKIFLERKSIPGIKPRKNSVSILSQYLSIFSIIFKGKCIPWKYILLPQNQHHFILWNRISQLVLMFTLLAIKYIYLRESGSIQAQWRSRQRKQTCKSRNINILRWLCKNSDKECIIQVNTEVPSYPTYYNNNNIFYK